MQERRKRRLGKRERLHRGDGKGRPRGEPRVTRKDERKGLGKENGKSEIDCVVEGKGNHDRCH